MNELIHVNDQIDENAKSKFHRLELQIQDRSDVNAVRITKVEEELRQLQEYNRDKQRW